MEIKPTIDWSEFEKIDIRTGLIVEAKQFEKANKPAFKLYIDFGEIGVLRSSAQITQRYSFEALIGMQILAVVNFKPKQIADFMSECLVLGIQTDEGVVLLTTAEKTGNGLPIS